MLFSAMFTMFLRNVHVNRYSIHTVDMLNDMFTIFLRNVHVNKDRGVIHMNHPFGNQLQQYDMLS